MKQVDRFFRRYILSTLGILILFFVINLSLISLFLLTEHLIGVKNSGFPIEHFASLIEKKEDIIAADSEVQDILIQTDTWAMLLDDNGTVIWQNNLPKELPLEYSATDIAIFSKWYLNDYPVKVWKHSDGLLVIGFQPGTSITFPKGRHFAVPLFFLRNSCIFCFLHNKIVPYAVRNFADSSPVLSIMI